MSVEPVVVMPDILSKNALVNEKLTSENIRGSEPKIAILSQDNAVNKKLVVNLISYHDQD